jgi:hypothetical protein
MNNRLAREALAADRVVLSVMGAHAGEDEATIFSRKIVDTKRFGRTFWVYGSHTSRPDRVQRSGSRFVLFLAPATSKGARPTTTADRASSFSADGSWSPLPVGMSPVTGRLAGKGYALVLSELALCDVEIDLWKYASGADAVRFKLGASTLPVCLKDTSSDPLRMLSRFRRVVAVGRLLPPLAVWIKK